MTENCASVKLPVIPITPHPDFSSDQGFDWAVEMCTGWICRKRTTGTMCPSFMAVREEEHATRGRAINALRAASERQLPKANSPASACTKSWNCA
ncbi:MAG: hypothetical protein H6656_09215 [Ardenticatenaceae bacterium]|nr:hypothetical protein [Ardenticatenaceae bacterium]